MTGTLTTVGMTAIGDEQPVLDVRSVRHRYGSTVALDGVSLQVTAGECVALLGPNGAARQHWFGRSSDS